MENQNKKNFAIVSMDVFAQVLSQIPEGKIIRVSDLLRFFEKSYGKMVYLDFPAYMEDPRWEQLPWWRIVGEEGELLDGLQGLMEQQVKFLEAYLSEKKVDKDYAALVLMEILSERGLVNKETLHAAREKLNSITDSPNPDLIRKFVTKIVPNGKTHFSWHLNLDGKNTCIQEMMVEGRKNHATVTFGVLDHSAPQPDLLLDIDCFCTGSKLPE